MSKLQSKLEIGSTYFLEGTNGKNWVGKLLAINGPYSVTLEQASWPHTLFTKAI